MKRHINRIVFTAAFTAVTQTCILADDAKTAPLTPPAPPPKWESSAFAGLTLTRGNSDTVLFTANVQTQRKDKDNEWAFGMDGAYGETDSVKNNELIHAFGQYNRIFHERWFGYARVDAMHDGIADVEYRVALSPGLGYYFIKNKDAEKKRETTLAAEVGPGLVFEKRGDRDDTYATLRVAERFEHKFNERARVWQTAEFLPQVDRFENYVIKAEIGAEAAVTKSISLQVVLQDTYVNEPAAGRKANDVKLISGITYKF